MAAARNRITLTARGQLTLRRRLLDHVGARPGDQLDIVAMPGGKLEISSPSSGTISDFFGSIGSDGGPALSLAEIDRVAAAGWSGER